VGSSVELWPQEGFVKRSVVICKTDSCNWKTLVSLQINCLLSAEADMEILKLETKKSHFRFNKIGQVEGSYIPKKGISNCAR